MFGMFSKYISIISQIFAKQCNILSDTSRKSTTGPDVHPRTLTTYDMSIKISQNLAL